MPSPGAPHAGPAYFITDLEPVSLWASINGVLTGVGLLHSALGVSGPRQVRGRPARVVLAHLRSPGEPPMTRFAAAEMATSHWYDLSGARTDFGYTPLVGPDEGLERALTWLKDELAAGRL